MGNYKKTLSILKDMLCDVHLSSFITYMKIQNNPKTLKLNGFQYNFDLIECQLVLILMYGLDTVSIPPWSKCTFNVAIHF